MTTRAQRRRALRAERREQRASDERAYGMNDPAWYRARVQGNVGNSEPYSGHATVYRCVRVLTNALISAPLVEITGPRRNPKIVEGGKWQPILDDPNPHQTQRQFVEGFGTYLLLDGEVGLYAEGANGPAQPGEIPRELWPLPAAALEPQVDETSKILLGWKVTTARGMIEVPAHSLTHLRFFNPADPLRGLAPLSAATTGLRSDLKAEAWGEAFFDNGAEPGGVLSTEGALSPKQRREMRESWEEKHRGSSRAHRVAVLEGGLSYQAIGIPQKDMQFIEQRNWNETQIAKVFGVPKFFLMDSADISYASTRQNKLALWELAVLPLVSMIEDVIRIRLCAPRTGRDDRIAWDLTKVDALREMVDSVVGTAEGLVRLGYPLNEVNERLGMGMLAQGWGDEGTLPMGVAPAEQVATGAGSDAEFADDPDFEDDDAETDPIPQEDKPKAEGEGGGGVETLPTTSENEIVADDSETPAKDSAEAGLPPAAAALNGAQIASLLGIIGQITEGVISKATAKSILLVSFPFSPEQVDELLADVEEGTDDEPDPDPGATPPVEPVRELDAEQQRRRDLWETIERDVNAPNAAALDRRLRGFVKGRRAEFLRFLSTLKRDATAKSIRQFLDDAEKRWAAQIAKQVRPIYRQTIASAIAQIARELGGLALFKASDPALARFIAEKEILVRGVPKSMIRSLRKALVASEVAGEDVGALQARLAKIAKNSKQVFRATMNRTLAIARSETAAVTNGTRRLAMEAEGVERVEWLTSKDENVRDETASPRKRAKANHRALDGEIRKVGETFVEGITLRNPGDVQAPAQWAVNCRCGIAPVRTK